MPVVLPTLPELKAETNITVGTNDVELTRRLNSAVDVVQGYVGPLESRSVTETHYAPSGRVLILRQSPVISITSVSNANGTTYVPADYVLDTGAGLLRRAYATGSWGGEVTVTYLAGRDTLPAALADAILIIAAHLWETQRGASPSPFTEDPLPVGRGFAVPNRALELMRPYLLGAQVA